MAAAGVSFAVIWPRRVHLHSAGTSAKSAGPRLDLSSQDGSVFTMLARCAESPFRPIVHGARLRVAIASHPRSGRRTGTDAAGLETEALRSVAHPGWKFARLTAGANGIRTLGPRYRGQRLDTATFERLITFCAAAKAVRKSNLQYRPRTFHKTCRVDRRLAMVRTVIVWADERAGSSISSPQRIRSKNTHMGLLCPVSLSSRGSSATVPAIRAARLRC